MICDGIRVGIFLFQRELRCHFLFNRDDRLKYLKSRMFRSVDIVTVGEYRQTGGGRRFQFRFDTFCPCFHFNVFFFRRHLL